MDDNSTSVNPEALEQKDTEELKVQEPVEENEETQPQEIETEKKPAESVGSLKELLEDVQPPLTVKKKYREVSEDDYVEQNGTYTIKSESLLDDMQEIFGGPNKEGDLKRFLHLNESKPKKATVIAQMSGFDNRFEFADLVIKYQNAVKNGDASKVSKLEQVFMEKAPWLVDENTPPPFSIDISKKKDEPKFSKKEIDSAINSYCANEGIKREELESIPGLKHEFERYYGAVVGGQKLNAEQALVEAMRVLPKDKTFVPTGGAPKSAVDSPVTKRESLLRRIEMQQKENRELGLPPLSQKFINDVLTGKQSLD